MRLRLLMLLVLLGYDRSTAQILSESTFRCFPNLSRFRTTPSTTRRDSTRTIFFTMVCTGSTTRRWYTSDYDGPGGAPHLNMSRTTCYESRCAITASACVLSRVARMRRHVGASTGVVIGSSVEADGTSGTTAPHGAGPCPISAVLGNTYPGSRSSTAAKAEVPLRPKRRISTEHFARRYKASAPHCTGKATTAQAKMPAKTRASAISRQDPSSRPPRSQNGRPKAAPQPRPQPRRVSNRRKVAAESGGPQGKGPPRSRRRTDAGTDTARERATKVRSEARNPQAMRDAPSAIWKIAMRNLRPEPGYRIAPRGCHVSR